MRRPKICIGSFDTVEAAWDFERLDKLIYFTGMVVEKTL